MNYLIGISVLPVALLGSFIYNQDKNKESKKLLKKLFIAGVLSTLLTLLLSFAMESAFPLLKSNEALLTKTELLIYAFIGVALVEEFSKWIMVYRIGYFHEEFDEIYDAIVYTTFVSLGFACLENICYVLIGGFATGILRAILSVPGHACFGIMMGYFLGIAKISQIKGEKSKEKKNLILSLIAATVAHGTYDYLLMCNDEALFVVFIIFVVAFFTYCYKMVKRISTNNHFLYPENESNDTINNEELAEKTIEQMATDTTNTSDNNHEEQNIT